MEKIAFESEEGEVLSFFVIEETKLNGTRYLMVSEQDPDLSEDVEGDATILKCVASDDEEETYEFVEDDAEWDALLSVFQELLIDTDIVEN
ncbi:MAG: DUF1292 domain-containing protein [Lachnospiraceae bacterium]|nr:DUF1292 domain-containing protein [Lachnospiraceae bacterium]